MKSSLVFKVFVGIGLFVAQAAYALERGPDVDAKLRPGYDKAVAELRDFTRSKSAMADTLCARKLPSFDEYVTEGLREFNRGGRRAGDGGVFKSYTECTLKQIREEAYEKHRAEIDSMIRLDRPETYPDSYESYESRRRSESLLDRSERESRILQSRRRYERGRNYSTGTITK